MMVWYESERKFLYTPPERKKLWDMKRFYSVHEVCALFSIDSSTLRRWRAALSIVPLIDSSHNSRRLFTGADVVALARAHHRFALLSSLIPDDSQRFDAGAVSALACQENRRGLVALLYDVERRLREVELRLAELVPDGDGVTMMSDEGTVPGLWGVDAGSGDCAGCCEQTGRGFCLDCGACDGEQEGID